MPHSFGLVSAYDGHPAGVGRITCDSTWHHFINVNLIGVLAGGDFDDFQEDSTTHTPANTPASWLPPRPCGIGKDPRVLRRHRGLDRAR